MLTCAHDEHTQQHVTLVLCGGHVVGKLWTGKALREDRVGLDDIRRKTAHRVPEEPTSDRHPSRRLRESEKSSALVESVTRDFFGRQTDRQLKTGTLPQPTATFFHVVPPK